MDERNSFELYEESEVTSHGEAKIKSSTDHDARTLQDRNRPSQASQYSHHISGPYQMQLMQQSHFDANYIHANYIPSDGTLLSASCESTELQQTT